MTSGQILMSAREMLVMALLLAGPFLVVSVAATFLMGLLQATTRMNDMALSFVPRFVAILVTMYLAASWMGAQLTTYIERSAVLAHTLIVTTALASGSGSVTAQIAGLNQTITSLNRQITQLQQQAQKETSLLTAQFSQAQATLSQLSTVSSFLDSYFKTSSDGSGG